MFVLDQSKIRGIVLYRGMTYKLPCVENYKKVNHAKENAVDHICKNIFVIFSMTIAFKTVILSHTLHVHSSLFWWTTFISNLFCNTFMYCLINVF